MKTRKLINCVASLVFMLFWINSANAAAILIGTPQNATGIKNLKIAEHFYDVVFSGISSFESSFDAEPTFINDQVSATQAAESILDTFNNFNVTSIDGINNTLLWVQIPFQVNDDIVFSTYLISSQPGTWLQGTSTSDNVTDLYSNVSWVSFVQAVPTPSTALILFVCLICVFLVRARAVKN